MTHFNAHLLSFIFHINRHKPKAELRKRSQIKKQFATLVARKKKKHKPAKNSSTHSSSGLLSELVAVTTPAKTEEAERKSAAWDYQDRRPAQAVNI